MPWCPVEIETTLYFMSTMSRHGSNSHNRCEPDYFRGSYRGNAFRLARIQRAFLLALAWSLCLPAIATVVPVPGHPQQPFSTNYTMTADGQAVEVKAERYGFDVGMFTMSSNPVTVNVTLSNDFTNYSLKPDRFNIATIRTGNTLSFTLPSPLKLVLQVDARTPLAILATPLETDVPNPGDTNVIYFGPGTNVAGVIQPTNHQTVYLAPGALVLGRIQVFNGTNVTVRGRGFLETAGYSTKTGKTPGILFSNCSNVQVEGIALRSYGTFWQSLYLNSRDILVDQMNIFGVTVNTDGVDIDGVKNFTVADSFIRSEDDGLGWHAVDAKANGEWIVDNAVANNLVIWNTGAGNGIRIGASMEDTLWHNVTISNVDILKYSGAGIYSDYSDWCWTEDLTFKNVAIAGGSNPIGIKIAKTQYSNNNGFMDRRGNYNRLVFDHVTAGGGGISLYGYDATHKIDNVYFNSCTNGGNPVDSFNDITTNAYVTNVRFNQPVRLPPPSPAGVYEAEYTDAVCDAIPQWVFADTNFDNGIGKVLYAGATGDFATYLLDVPLAGVYEVKLYVKRGTDSGRFQASLNGVNCGAEQDLYAATNQYELLDLGRITVNSSGQQPLKFLVTGKNPASTSYLLKIDYIQLIPVAAPSARMTPEGFFQLQWTAPTNNYFVLQWTSNLAAPVVWQTSDSPIQSSTTNFAFVDTNVFAGEKFYRLVSYP